jgi:serine/threonine protein kinase/Tol biopolymer transport system component
VTLATGNKLGPNEISATLGAGGMGEVYRARDARLGRAVAIKVLPTSFSSDRDRLQRFIQEARAAAGLNHPNILSIFDIGEEKGAPYIVSELLEGETLREKLRNGPIPIRKAVEYALQTARGLAAAHDKGIVHRDLKPENLFVTDDGHVKILDFGLAKLTRPEEQSGAADAATVQAITEPGLVMGTVGYMSPEQVRGKAADPRSDLFSFGAILYEMISGKRAFHGETTADTMSAILKEEPPELSETARNVPPGLERIVRHCLEKNPAQRFQSARDLAFDLEVLTEVSGTGGSKLPTAVREEIRADSRRRIAQIAGAIVVAAALLAFGWWLGHRNSPSSPAEYQQITFRTGQIGNARFAPDGTIVYNASWENNKNQLYLARTDDNGSHALGINDADLLAISKNAELAVRLNTINLGGYARAGTLARLPLSGGTPREVLDNVGDADWSADGDKLAVTVFVPATRHWHLEYPIGKVLFDTINWITTPKISPDGKWVAIADHENPSGDDQGSVAVISMDGREKKLSSGWTSVEGIVWSPSGDEIWFSASNAGSSDNLRGVTLDGKLRTIANVPGGMWTEDIRNGVLLVVSQQQRVELSGVPPGSKEERELGWLGWSTDMKLSSDGKKVLFTEEADGGGPNYTVFLRDTDGSPPVRISDGLGVAISPDNKWVVTESARGGPLSLVPAGAGEVRQLTHDNITYTDATFLPDRTHLLADGIETGHGARAYLIDLNSGDSKALTPEGTTGNLVSPDGKKVIMRGPDGRLGVWLLGENKLKTIPGLDPNFLITSWLPDSTTVYANLSRFRQKTAKVYKLNTVTGKAEFWREFGNGLSGGISSVVSPVFSRDGSAYCYIYVRLLSQAYVARGLK